MITAASCSGGGGGGTGLPSASTTSVTTSGTITGFGSVKVNGREFEINDSTETTKDGSFVRGDAAAKSVLRVGMVVTVSGSFSGTTRTASKIEHHNTLEGPIQSINKVDANNGTLVVMGQTVVIDDTTKFDDCSGQPPTCQPSVSQGLDSLSDNDFVEVSGFVKDDGANPTVIMASFIEKKVGVTGCDSGGKSICEVKGRITAHTRSQETFQIGNLKVDYSTANTVNMIGITDWSGVVVEVKGVQFTAGPNLQTEGTLQATKVEPEGFDAPDGNRVELEGFVTSVDAATPPTSFVLGTTMVQVIPGLGGTVYLGGLQEEIAVGQKLEVQGSISNGAITATKVKFQNSVRLEGIVDSIAGTGNAGTLTIAGLTNNTNSIEVNWDNSEVLKNNMLPQLGHRVRVRGREGQTVASSPSVVKVIAMEVEDRGNDSCYKLIPPIYDNCDVELQGAVDNIGNQTLTIVGFTVDTSTFNFSDFKGLDDDPNGIGPTAFFNAAKVGTLVKAKGRLTGTVLSWREVELESD
ncbi:DUF5666 domain-containing protein [Petrachloros mirabilis]